MFLENRCFSTHYIPHAIFNIFIYCYMGELLTSQVKLFSLDVLSGRDFNFILLKDIR